MLIFDIFQKPYQLFTSIAPGLAESILGAIALIVGILTAIIFHETAHGFAALKCGDETAKRYGRLTLNPLKHLDPLGTFMLLIVGFGWAKPVPVNPNNFKKPRRDNFIVSIAGIAVNLLTAFFALGLLMLIAFLVNNNAAFFIESRFAYLSLYLFYYFLNFLVMISLGLALFNILPFYPLDGFHLLESIAGTQSKFVIFMRQYSGILIIVLIGFRYLPFSFSPLTWYIQNCLSGIMWLFEGFWGLFGL